MRDYSMNEIAEITGGTLLLGDGDRKVNRAFADSRLAEAGGLYFALKGENRDGHEFLRDVIEKGVSALVVSDEKALEEAARGNAGIAAVITDDTSAAMKKLASHYLMSLGALKIGITGSTGKTSTKDMMYAVSSVKYRTGRNLGNLNTVQGLCMTILGMEPDTEVAVLEMGMDRKGEIHELAEVIRPDIALITNIGTAHIERLGSRENIFRAKMEIVDMFGENAVLIASKGRDLLRRENISHGYEEGREKPEGSYKVIMTGEDRDNDYIVKNIEERGLLGISFDIERDGADHHMDLHVMGRHNALNAALAAAAGREMGIPFEDIAEGLRHMGLTGGRLTVKRGVSGSVVIDDTYNANPDSMGAAIKTLSEQKCARRIAILGDMFELGDDAVSLHRGMGEAAAELGIDMVIAVGTLARHIAEGAGGIAEYYKTADDFIARAGGRFGQGDIILVKASHGMHLERIADALSEEEDK